METLLRSHGWGKGDMGGQSLYSGMEPSWLRGQGGQLKRETGVCSPDAGARLHVRIGARVPTPVR